MEDRATVQKNWYEFGKIVDTGVGFEIRDLLIRWNERIELHDDDDDMTEYIYDCHRFTIKLDESISPGQAAIEYYLECSKDAIIAKAQSLATQEAGFNVD